MTETTYKRHYNPSYQRGVLDGAKNQETGICGLYRFENQHGASVIYCHPGEQISQLLLYELAHVMWREESTGIHSWVFASGQGHIELDIETCLTETEVQERLDRIAGL